MTDTTKNRLGIALIISVLALSYAAIRYVGAYSDSIQPGSFRSFPVSAEGKAVAIPNVATFSFGLITEGGKDIGALQKENTDKINDTIAFLKENGVPEKDIKTESYSIQPRYAPCPRNAAVCPSPEIIGYSIIQNISVKIRDFTKTGTVLSGIVEKGANSVSGLSFTIDDPTSVETEARSEAMKKARAKAEAVAKAGGFRIGKVLSISEGFYPVPFYGAATKEFALGGDLAAPAVPPTIEPGSEEVRVNVTVVYEIR